jgi:hypothetical protein
MKCSDGSTHSGCGDGPQGCQFRVFLVTAIVCKHYEVIGGLIFLARCGDSNAEGLWGTYSNAGGIIAGTVVWG